MWWSKEAVDKFKERAQCFVEQYSQYELFGISVSIIPFSWKVNIYKNYTIMQLYTTQVNGNQTLGENIADNGGIRASYDVRANFPMQTAANSQVVH